MHTGRNKRQWTGLPQQNEKTLKYECDCGRKFICEECFVEHFCTCEYGDDGEL